MSRGYVITDDEGIKSLGRATGKSLREKVINLQLWGQDGGVALGKAASAYGRSPLWRSSRTVQRRFRHERYLAPSICTTWDV
jgi:hypothetical protein